MPDFQDFMRAAKENCPTIAQRAVAVLWFEAQSEPKAERTTTWLAAKLHEVGFARPHVTKLQKALKKSGLVVRGSTPDTFKLDFAKLDGLDDQFSSMIGARKAQPKGTFVSLETTPTRADTSKACVIKSTDATSLDSMTPAPSYVVGFASH
jgi:hypothetical protein